MSDILQTIYGASIDWLSAHGFKILTIIVIAYAAEKIGKVFMEKIIRKVIIADRFLNKEAEKKREDTLVRILQGVLRVAIWLLAAMMVLSEAGADIGPLLAGAGIAGLAFGFGGQYLIKDVIAGLFIILENQYRVGDKVCLDGTCGIVEDMNLRTTILRDSEGTAHYIHNGLIARTSNFSKKKKD